jgi:hypothetical protein
MFLVHNLAQMQKVKMKSKYDVTDSFFFVKNSLVLVGNSSCLDKFLEHMAI